MPLKFLKKCRQYNVTSKNLFVIPVHHLLDTSTTVDCTISSESKGQECLDNVCQRLLIQQPEFFGLRYVVKGRGGADEKDDDEEDVLRWIDLERSLSRQLEKYAAGTKIYLRVRHYVTTGVRHLSDEVTRYYYFLQLKSDIYEGKIACDIRTAILLALYCRQAEYDSYQQPTRDYTKKSLVLPKNLQGLVNDDNLLDGLIVEVLHQNNGNGGIQHLNQLQAEEMYIQCCQQLDGYGEERFQAKDTLGNDLQLGLAINGMVVTSDNGRQYFPWRDFNTVTIEKRTIKIEQHKADGSIVGSFIFGEADVARYFWKLCITQHKFFKRHIDEEALGGGPGGDGESSNGMGAETATFVSGSGYDFGDSREDLLLEQQQRAIYTSGSGAAQLAGSQQQMPHGLMASNVSLVDSANGFRDVPLRKSVTSAASQQSSGGNGGAASIMHAHSGGALAQSWLMTKDYESNHEYTSQQQQQQHHHHQQQHHHQHHHHQQQQQQQQQQLQQQHHPHHLSGSFLDNRLQSTSCLDLSNTNNNNTNASNGNLLHSSSGMLAASSTSSGTAAALLDAHERERLKALLPTYRPAPDYETAVQLKYQRMAGYPSATPTPTPTNIYYHAGSQPDVHNAAAASLYGGASGESAAGMLLSAHHHLAPHYPDVAQPAAAMHHAASHHLSGATATVTVRTKPLPPPYPVSRVSSSSTPDLAAVATHRPLWAYGRSYVSGSSPDLVSHRNILNAAQFQMQQYMSNIGQQQYLAAGPQAQVAVPQHSTFENLNMIEEQPSIIEQLRQAQSYDQHPSTYQRQQQQQQTVTILHNTHSGSIEPIYENVPLPPQYPATTSTGLTVNQRNSEHRSSGSASSQHAIDPMRNRTASIQSAPGGIPPPAPSASAPVPAARQHHGHHNAQHADRAASTELHFLEPTPPQRSVRAASAAPAIGVGHAVPQPAVTPPPRAHKIQLMKTASSVSAVDATTNSATRHNTTASHDDSLLLHQQFGAMNLSASSSTASTAFNSTLDSSAATAHSSSASSSAVKDGGKRKKRWNILGRSKTPDKQKSATLGREKASTSNSKLAGKLKLAQDDSNLPYRWSTGVPRLQAISGQYSKDKLCQILDEKLHDTQLFMEFEGIPKRRDAACYDCALMPENALKNSDPNFLPYDDNRVRITPTMENRHGYVNASHITATVGAKQRFYIVAQSPREPLTTRIFWQCVWEADVYLVVQLSEDSNYIPSTTQQRLEFGQFQVYQEFSQTTDRCVTSKLRLFHMQSRRYRSVWHLNYTDWAEQNCPRDVNHFLDFLEELNSVRMASVNEVPPGHNTNPPVLIHCHEGGGRSGVTLTAELLLYTLDHNEDLDIPRVIGQLRHQRDSIIPSLAQYKFIYSLLITYLKRTRLI